MADSITAKTINLEDLRSEKRILQAERDEALKRLLSIQHDLEDVTDLEKKLSLETQTLQRNLVYLRADQEYVQTRGILPEDVD
jgi:predicted  nucleic acid-binding Zn-ribbon protein